MAAISRSLNSIKNDLINKKILSSAAWSLPTTFSKTDEKQLKKTIAALPFLEMSVILREKRQLEENINYLTNDLKNRKVQLKKALEKMEEIDKLIKSQDVYKPFEKIIEQFPIKHVEILGALTTVFTTELIKKDDRVVGSFRIFIDWTKSSWENAVVVRNLYKSDGGYDHPCISSGRICSGTATTTFRECFLKKDIYGLVEALISFIVSDDVHAGFIRSWNDFHTRASIRKVTDINFGQSFGSSLPNGASARETLQEIISKLETKEVK